VKVKLAINIGHRDAAALGLQSLSEGSVLEVTQEVADALLERGWAVEASPRKIKGVPGGDLKAVPE
jgi:hypothetical protein